ncbi:MAG: cytochrome c peroxidase [Cocleimonas sp.]|jgi:cytochrome c peroxidase
MKVMIMGVLLLIFSLLSIIPTLSYSANNATENVAPVPLAPGYGTLGYELAEVGSYKLPALNDAPDGKVLDENGQQVQLHNMYKGKYTLLSFMYSNCKDVNGCPLSSYVFYKIKAAMNKDPLLASNLRLASLSFDPENDSPEVMQLYGNNFKFAGNKGEWRFLTTSSLESLNPVLQAYNQDIQRQMSVNGDQTEDISHILRVFLIDPKLKIRNIYSVGFLHPDLLINDVKTLLLEDDAANKPIMLVSDEYEQKAPILSVPGDLKDGYETTSYTTQSKSLTNRNGVTADLFAVVKNPPLGLPKVSEPIDNPITKEKITLGRKLFFDRRLSLNDTFSCAMCHVPEQGFASNELSIAVGIEGRSVRRNTPTIYNIAYATKLFHDGREDSLEQQIWAPLLAKNEMANPSIGYVINKIRAIPEYKGMFEKAFDGESVSMNTLSKAFANYQRALVSGDSPFDRWYFSYKEKDKKQSGMTKKAKRGFKLFTGKGSCSSCHTINKDYALFTDYQMHNTGIGFNESMGIRPATERVALAPGVFVDVDTSIIDSVGEKTPADTGLYEITQNPNDRWKYKTPSLRNVTLTAPYIHNGSLSRLEDVMNFYNKGGVENSLQDPRIKPLNLDQNEQDEMVAFLKSLTGSNVDLLVSDAFAAPVGDLTEDDPNWVHEIAK